MKKICIACLALSALTIAMARPAMAQGAGLTRQQVAAETALFLAVHDWVYSGRKKPPIPKKIGHLFRLNVATLFRH